LNPLSDSLDPISKSILGWGISINCFRTLWTGSNATLDLTNDITRNLRVRRLGLARLSAFALVARDIGMAREGASGSNSGASIAKLDLLALHLELKFNF
jgi:hypothetical protein